MSNSSYKSFQNSILTKLEPAHPANGELSLSSCQHQRHLEALKRSLAKRTQSLLQASSNEELLQEMAGIYHAFMSLQTHLCLTEGDLKQALENKLQQTLNTGGKKANVKTFASR